MISGLLNAYVGKSLHAGCGDPCVSFGGGSEVVLIVCDSCGATETF